MTTSYDDLPRQTSTVERVVTVLLMVGLAVLVPLASFFGLFFGMASDGCVGDTRCSSGRISAGIVISSGSPWGAVLWALGGFVAVSGVG